MPPKAKASALLAMLATHLTPMLGGCGSPDKADPSTDGSSGGLLQFDLNTDLEGARFVLEATFTLNAERSFFLTLASPPRERVTMELTAGSHTVEIHPDYEMFRDDAVALTKIDAELWSDAVQTFEIVADDTTRVSYWFR